jgi:cytochrome c peroxidase
MFDAADLNPVRPTWRGGIHWIGTTPRVRTACHIGPLLSDEQFHNTGVAWAGDRFLDDGRVGVTGRDADRGAFKTPTLREVARTAPYMHDGSLGTLDEGGDFNDRGGRPVPDLDREIRPLGLTGTEKAAAPGLPARPVR